MRLALRFDAEDYLHELATGEPPRRKIGSPLFRSPL
jgi:hypothetical protein